MSRQLYRGKILEHYKEPRKFGTVDDPGLDVEVANPHCGDVLRFTGRVEDGELVLRFEGDGCALSIAAASLLADRLDGAAVDAVEDVSEEELFDMLGIQKDTIAPVRVKCVLLGKRGIEELVSDG